MVVRVEDVEILRKLPGLECLISDVASTIVNVCYKFTWIQPILCEWMRT